MVFKWRNSSLGNLIAFFNPKAFLVIENYEKPSYSYPIYSFFGLDEL
jgi:hypothetical protein